jgi:hypothetical protein
MFDVDRMHEATEMLAALPPSDFKGDALATALCSDD